MAKFYSARSKTILPLPWQTFALPFSLSNAASILPLLDGAIVGSSLKADGVWWNSVELERVVKLVAAVKRLRER